MLFTPLEQQFVYRRYVIAVSTAILAILLRLLLEPLLGHTSFYATAYMAVLYSALICGLWPSVLTAAIGIGGMVYWFVDPRHSILVPRSEVQALVGCILVAGVLIVLGESNRRKQLMVNESRDLLEVRVQERTAELSKTLASLAGEVTTREAAEEGLRHLSVQLMRIQDDERRRIARDLHDTAGQTLAAIKMTSALIRQAGEAVAQITGLTDDLDALSDEALREIRTTSHLLHPPLLDEAGFISAARWFVEGFSKRSGIEVAFDAQENLGRLPGNTDIVLFRILQESLTNVHRHAQCSAASVAVKRENGGIVLQVKDNGQGFSKERLQAFRNSNAPAGVGLAGMRERVRELGGQLELDSGTSGTTVRAIIPERGQPGVVDGRQLGRVSSAS